MTEDQAITLVRLETDQRGHFRVVDKSGPNVIVLSEHEKYLEAREAWEAACKRLMAVNN